ncbi:hypothetical protein [Candidatus Magnetominusculus xianensis]|uniref:Rpn family recombination-promoting nuclease/putative transposase n=1 Tax=Candidatus Magnetominusculus xianensis TaxID=1748249 RepID=A0ABR5SHH4_9BACT|nr:hypothetical protein [Candidatus Magnetominusculus xianensis]KWT82791.1 hypothetical protein ASN18_2380 [Candidatus Magnetominusculus xianensis]MBF0403480.1 hypothetical protein [Nitrospirota bacterium]
MSKRYDKIIKEILRDVVDTLLTNVIGLKAIKSTPLETKLQITNEREADFILLVELEDGTQRLIHIEFQSTNYSKMAYRELRYWVYIAEIYGIQPLQYVFYIGNETLNMPDNIKAEKIDYSYNLIDMRDVDCNKFLYSNKPEEVIISILCNYQKKGVKIFISEILSRLRELVPEETLRGKYIKQVEVLSQLRELQNDVCKEAEAMAIMYDMERDIRFKQGLAKGQRKGLLEGQREGKREGLLEGIELGLELKYGSSGLELMDMARVVDSIDKLEAFKNLIKKAGSLDELRGFLRENI